MFESDLIHYRISDNGIYIGGMTDKEIIEAYERSLGKSLDEQNREDKE